MQDNRDEIPLQEIIYKPTTEEYNVATELKPESQEKINFYLYFIATIANLLSFATGFAMLWITPVLPKLDGTDGLGDNPFGRAITATQTSWLAGLLPLGSIFGPLVGGKIVDVIGRKPTILILASLQSVTFLIPVFAKTISLFYVSRFLSGIACGSFYATVPMYLTEIAENHNRGALGCSVAIFVAAGINFALIIGPYLTISVFSIVGICPLIIFLIAFFLLSPETPPYLASINDTKNLEASLRKLRNKSVEKIRLEMANLLETTHESKQEGKIQDLFKVKYLRRALVISLGLAFIQQGVGTGVVYFYMPAIFRAGKANIPAEFLVMIVGASQLLGTILSMVVVDRAGRRILLIASCLCISVSLAALALFFNLKSNHFDVDRLAYLPVASLTTFIIALGIGLGPVPWVVIAELFPTSIRSVAVTIMSVSCFLITFIVTVTFPSLSLSLGMDRCFFVFSLISLLGCIFIYWMLPETKGKSLQEIQKLLGRN